MILYHRQTSFILKTCYVAFGQLTYSNHFRIDKTKFGIRSNFTKIVQVSIQKDFVHATAYTCHGYITDSRGNLQPTEKYRFMQGLNPDEIILLETINESDLITKFKPIELIKNLNNSYINLMFYK